MEKKSENNFFIENRYLNLAPTIYRERRENNEQVICLPPFVNSRWMCFTVVILGIIKVVTFTAREGSDKSETLSNYKSYHNGRIYSSGVFSLDSEQCLYFFLVYDVFYLISLWSFDSPYKSLDFRI